MKDTKIREGGVPHGSCSSAWLQLLAWNMSFPPNQPHASMLLPRQPLLILYVSLDLTPSGKLSRIPCHTGLCEKLLGVNLVIPRASVIREIITQNCKCPLNLLSPGDRALLLIIIIPPPTSIIIPRT